MRLRAESGDRHVDLVAVCQELWWLHPESDAGRRAGNDQIAGAQCHELAHVANDVIDRKDHVLGLAELALFAVDLQAQFEPVRTPDFVGTDEPRADRRERVETLALAPLAALVQLPVAFGYVIHHAVAGDAGPRVVVADAGCHA